MVMCFGPVENATCRFVYLLWTRQGCGTNKGGNMRRGLGRLRAEDMGLDLKWVEGAPANSTSHRPIRESCRCWPSQSTLHIAATSTWSPQLDRGSTVVAN